MPTHPDSLDNGRYELRRPLGKGGTATVFEAWDSELRCPVAIKLLVGGTSGRAGLRRRLQAETVAMRQVKHKNVLSGYEFRSEGGIDFVIMALAPNGSLQDRLDAYGPRPIEEALGYVVQVLAGLSAAHAVGVVHRDVKPQNVLLDDRQVALLADFGIARVPSQDGESGHTRAGVAMGSFAYMPPEQRLDAHEVDARADIYAAGATLYALLTAGNPVDLFTAGADSVRWAGIPGPLVDVLRRATAQSVEDRFQTARAFGLALARAGDDIPPEVRVRPIVTFPDLPLAAVRVEGEPDWRLATREAVTYLGAVAPASSGGASLPPEAAGGERRGGVGVGGESGTSGPAAGVSDLPTGPEPAWLSDAPFESTTVSPGTTGPAERDGRTPDGLAVAVLTGVAGVGVLAWLSWGGFPLSPRPDDDATAEVARTGPAEAAGVSGGWDGQLDGEPLRMSLDDQAGAVSGWVEVGPTEGGAARRNLRGSYLPDSGELSVSAAADGTRSAPLRFELTLAPGGGQLDGRAEDGDKGSRPVILARGP